MKLVLTCTNKRCENFLKDIEKEKKLDRICENGYFFKRCDLLLASAVMRYKVFRDEESAREVAELTLKAVNGEVLGEAKLGEKNGSK